MKLIPLTKGRFARVDDRDFDFLNQWKWHYSESRHCKTGYARRNIFVDGKNKTIRDYPLDARVKVQRIGGCKKLLPAQLQEKGHFIGGAYALLRMVHTGL